MFRNGRLFRETCQHDIGTHGRFAARFVTATGLAIFHRAMETGGWLCQAGRAVVPGFCDHLEGRRGKIRAGEKNESPFGVTTSLGRIATSLGRVTTLATRDAALVG